MQDNTGEREREREEMPILEASFLAIVDRWING